MVLDSEIAFAPCGPHCADARATASVSTVQPSGFLDTATEYASLYAAAVAPPWQMATAVAATRPSACAPPAAAAWEGQRGDGRACRLSKDGHVWPRAWARCIGKQHAPKPRPQLTVTVRTPHFFHMPCSAF